MSTTAPTAPAQKPIAPPAHRSRNQRQRRTTYRPVPPPAPVYTSWFGVPESVSPSQPVRHAGSAVVLGAIAAAMTYAGLTWVWRAALGGTGSYLWDACGAAAEAARAVSFGLLDSDTARAWMDVAQSSGHAYAAAGCAAAAFAGALWAGGETAASMMQPRTSVEHLSGVQLIEGEAAWSAIAQHEDTLPAGAENDPAHRWALPLCAARDLWWDKPRWSRGLIVSGSVGSGKSQFILPIVNAIAARGGKALIYDAKGEYLQALGHHAGTAILAPHDARSISWDIAADCPHADDARVLAERLAITAEGSQGGGNAFFKDAASGVIGGIIASLQIKNRTAWGWDTLAREASGTREQLHAKLVATSQMLAADYIKDQTPTSDSIMSTVRNALKVATVLGKAWPYRAGRPQSERFSVRAWVSDDYNAPGHRHGPRVVFLKADGAMTLAGQWIGLLLEMAEARINSPELRDDMTGRCLGVILDELTSVTLSPRAVAGLYERGRAKGCVPIMGVQSLDQVKRALGVHDAAALRGMVGTHVGTQTQMSATRDETAQRLGRQRVKFQLHGSANRTHAAQEEERQTVAADYLTSRLGMYRDGDRFFNRLIVYTGEAVNVLDFPGRAWKKRAEPFVQAAWVQQETADQRAAYEAKLAGADAAIDADAGTRVSTATGGLDQPDRTWAKMDGGIKAPATEPTAPAAAPAPVSDTGPVIY